jgi:hypothetical protein
MMIVYTTGNGYFCGCCRRTDRDYEHYDTEEEALADLTDIARRADWDFSISTIEGYDGDAWELEQRLERMIKIAEEDQDRLDRINRLKRSISDIEYWFTNLEETKASKQEELEKLKVKLEEEMK